MPVFLAVTAAHKGILLGKFAFLHPVHRLHCRRALILNEGAWFTPKLDLNINSRKIIKHLAFNFSLQFTPESNMKVTRVKEMIREALYC